MTKPMTQRMPDGANLSGLIAASPVRGRAFATSDMALRLDEFSSTTRLGDNLLRLAGRSVILLTDNALAAGAALIELDGLARRIVLCPPDFDRAHLRSVARDSEADAIVFSGTQRPPDDAGVELLAQHGAAATARSAQESRKFATEWVLMTSGTTDRKSVV